MRPLLLVTSLILGLACAVEVAATTVTALSAQHRHGQTFLVWSTPPGAGWRYRVHRSSSPIASTFDLLSAAPVAVVGDSTWKDRRLSQLRGQSYVYRLDSLGAELTPAQAVCVITPASDRMSFYAVTAQQGAASEDQTIIAGENALAMPVGEMVALTRPVFQRTLTNGNLSFDVYTTFANPEDTPLVAAMTTAHGSAFDHAVVRGAPGGPLYVRPHARGGSFLNVLGGSGEPGEWRVALDDDLQRSGDRNSFWYGYHSAYDLDAASPLTPIAGVVRRYTLNRILHTFAWARRELPCDTTRVIAGGGSMGAIGSLRLAFAASSWLAGIHLVVPKFDFSYTSDPNPANIWNEGAPERRVADHLWGAVPTNLPTDDGIPVYDRLNDGVLAQSAHGRGLPYIVAFNGRNDVVVGWGEKIDYYAAAQNHRQGGTYFWDMRDHSGNGAGWSPMENVRRLYRLRTDRSYPAFANASSDDDPGTGALTSGDSLGAINGHLDWDTTLVDQPDGWNCLVTRRDLTTRWGARPAPASITVDITPRRLQRFAPVAGELLQWEVRRLADDVLSASGAVQVDSLGLATLPQVPVTGSGARVMLYRSNALAVPEASGSALALAARPLRNPTRGMLDLALAATPGSPLRAELHDVTGRRLRTTDTIIPAAASSTLRWDVAGLDPGLYFVLVRQGGLRNVTRVTILR